VSGEKLAIKLLDQVSQSDKVVSIGVKSKKIVVVMGYVGECFIFIKRKKKLEIGSSRSGVMR